ncbi:DUF938 domain-containing protein [Lysobacter sp. Root604]|uniref:DUF938 domain-containing protein n=1 Tax=Lysobacter sp. Root604 TaxID=1736568 RepID=UPI0006FBBA66|nr:DUF938 domain-containing protein [Lysobacter sp. Root604]KRA16965.1 hypothetical protein ASD69_09490 [Lysobacter sp. Root604]
MSGKPHSPSCERNREPILAVLRRHLPARANVLEIGSGTGQHAVHFAAAMPGWVWQCSDRAQHLPGIRAWLDEAALANTPPPFELSAATAPVPGFAPPPRIPTDPVALRSGYDAVFSANTLHIMGWPQVEAVFAGLATVLADAATVAIYGPFNYAGAYTSDSNRDFDGWLKQRDPVSGIRDFEAVDALARGIGLDLVDDVEMPAHNRSLIWRR